MFCSNFVSLKRAQSRKVRRREHTGVLNPADTASCIRRAGQENLAFVCYCHETRLIRPNCIMHVSSGEPGSSVGIATYYGLDSPGPNSGGDEIFRPSTPALGHIQWYIMGTVSFPGVEAAGV